GASAVFVVPQVGMWINKLSMSGEGNITVYTGAGIGEAEDRFPLQSWTCMSMPEWIWSLETVITMEADESCSFLLHYSNGLTSYSPNIYRHDKVVILISGKSDNLQNREGFN
ncbi:hypothetical protein PMAYCL1PPCAC_19500, partial [Pristionchus mayeri]